MQVCFLPLNDSTFYYSSKKNAEKCSAFGISFIRIMVVYASITPYDVSKYCDVKLIYDLSFENKRNKASLSKQVCSDDNLFLFIIYMVCIHSLFRVIHGGVHLLE